MKRIILFFALQFLVITLWGCGTDEVIMDLSKLEEVSLETDMQYFDYNNLEKEADIIAKVIILDNLTSENSMANYMDVGKESYLVSALSKRSVRVLEYYKNNSGTDAEELEVLEGAAVVGNQYIHDEGYEPLKQGKVYIIYLSNETASGEYGLISGSNSVVDIEAPIDDMQYADISVKTLVNYESDLTDEDKQTILEKDIKFVDDIPEKKEDVLNISVDTDSGEQDINLVYQEKSDDILVEK